MLAIVAFSVLAVLPDEPAVDWLLAAGLVLLVTAVTLWRAAEGDRSAWQNAIDAMQAGNVAYDRNDHLLFTNAEFRRLYSLSDRDTVPGVPYEHLLRPRRGRPDARGTGARRAWFTERIAERRDHGGGVAIQRMADGPTGTGTASSSNGCRMAPCSHSQSMSPN